MKTLLLIIAMLISLTTFAGSTPLKVSLWGSMPPGAANPGDSIHFLANPTGGSDIEYRFLSSTDFNLPMVIKDWSSSKSTNVVLPQNFISLIISVEARGIGESSIVSASQSFGFFKDIVLSTSQADVGDTLKIFHPNFHLGQNFNVSFSKSTGFSQSANGSVIIEGELSVIVPNTLGMYSVYVDGIVTRTRPLLTILEGTGSVNPIAAFGFSPAGGSAPLNLTVNGTLSYLPGHENEPDRGIALCEWTVTNSTGDKFFQSNNCIANFLLSVAGDYQITLKAIGINGAFSILTQPYTVSVGSNNVVVDFSTTPDTGTAPLQVTVDGTASYLPGHEAEPGRGILNCDWTYTNSTGDKKKRSNENSCITQFNFSTAGVYNITLTVQAMNGQIAAKTKMVIVTQANLQGSISGITYRENQGVVGNVPVVVTFTSNNTSYNTTSDSNGKFSFNVPFSGNYTITAQINNLKGFASGNLIEANPTQETPVNLQKTGIGKFSGTAVMTSDPSQILPNASMVIRAFDNSFEAYTVTNSEGKFNFENLPLVGRYYIAVFHEDGRFRNSSFVLSPEQPEVININYQIGTLPGFPFLNNAAFPFGGFESWFGLGFLAITPQSDAFGSGNTGDKIGAFYRSHDPLPLPYHFPQEWYEQEFRLPPRPKSKNKIIPRTEIRFDKILPCENRSFSGLATTAQLTDGIGQGVLEQYITIEDDAETLIGRVRFLTNETFEAGQMGYNDTFTVLFSNPNRSIFLKQGDVKNLTWGPGVLGFSYATEEFNIAVDLRSLRGKKAKLSFLVFDRGDGEVFSGIALSNFQIIKSSERNFVEIGTFNGDGSLSKNLGAVSWLKVKNTKPLSAFALNNQDFHVLRKNEEVEIPSVKFGDEPLVKTFNFDALSSLDIFDYTLESNWVSGMPTSACLAGGF